MHNSDAIMASVLENPNDDLPRLVYADFLEENNQPERAAFIRVQCELARMSTTQIIEDQICQRCKRRCGDRPGSKYCEHGSDPDGKNSHAWRNPLRRRERELWDSMYRGIQPGFEWDYPADGKYDQTKRGGPHLSDMSRGFVSRLVIAWSDWLTHHDALFWSPRQTVECPKCKGSGRAPFANEWQCWTCGKQGIRGPATGRVPRPMTRKVRCVNNCRNHATHPGWRECELCIDGYTEQHISATCQPLETVRLTTHPRDERYHAADPQQAFFTVDGHRFTRVPCPTCDGTGYNLEVPTIADLGGECPTCHGTPPNRWTCDTWRGVVFEMPEAARQPIGFVESVNEDGTVNVRLGQRLDAERAYHYGDVPAGTRPR